MLQICRKKSYPAAVFQRYCDQGIAISEWRFSKCHQRPSTSFVRRSAALPNEFNVFTTQFVAGHVVPEDIRSRLPAFWRQISITQWWVGVVTIRITELRNACSSNKTPTSRLTHSIFDKQRNHVATYDLFLRHFMLINYNYKVVYMTLCKTKNT